MSPHLRCTCGHELPLADVAQGREIKCPACGVPQFVPSLASVMAMSNARGQRVARLNFEEDRTLQAQPFLDDEEGYEPPDFNLRRPR